MLTQVKYLGLILYKGLTWKQHIQHIVTFKSAKRLIKTKFKKQYTEWISTKSKDQSWGKRLLERKL